MSYAEGLSASDVALLSGNTGRNTDGFGDGAGSGWWIIIFLIFAMFGWGRNGFGGGSGSGAADNYVLASDFATLQRQIDSATNTLERKADATQQGLCDGFYAMNTGMLNGFSGVNQSIMTNGYETRNAIQGISSQLATCCCNLEKGQMETNYINAQNTCSINNTIQATGRNTIDAINNIYNNLHNEIIANRIEDKNAQIQMQQNEINALRLSASQSAQNAYLINQLKPCPNPAYIVPNPNCCYNYGCNC